MTHNTLMQDIFIRKSRGTILLRYRCSKTDQNWEYGSHRFEGRVKNFTKSQYMSELVEWNKIRNCLLVIARYSSVVTLFEILLEYNDPSLIEPSIIEVGKWVVKNRMVPCSK